MPIVLFNWSVERKALRRGEALPSGTLPQGSADLRHRADDCRLRRDWRRTRGGQSGSSAAVDDLDETLKHIRSVIFELETINADHRCAGPMRCAVQGGGPLLGLRPAIGSRGPVDSLSEGVLAVDVTFDTPVPPRSMSCSASAEIVVRVTDDVSSADRWPEVPPCLGLSLAHRGLPDQGRRSTRVGSHGPAPAR